MGRSFRAEAPCLHGPVLALVLQEGPTNWKLFHLIESTDLLISNDLDLLCRMKQYSIMRDEVFVRNSGEAVHSGDALPHMGNTVRFIFKTSQNDFG